MTLEKLIHRIKSSPDTQLGVGATEDDIVDAERALGVPLKGAYRQFLRSVGWVGIGPFEVYGLGADVPEYLHLVTVTESERREMHPRLPVHLIPVMNDGGGNLLCLDTTTSEPTVVYWDHEQGEEQIPQHQASDFLEWLSAMIDDASSRKDC